MKKFCSLFILVCILISCAACGTEIGPSLDGKIPIYVHLYTGGFGDSWMIELLEEYNQSLDDYKFIKLPATKDLTPIVSDKIVGGVSDADIFYTEPVALGILKDSKYLEDLTSIYENPAKGETQPIKNKVKYYDTVKQVFSDASGSSIYALPITEGISGLIYDHDLFLLMSQDATTGNYYDQSISWLILDPQTESGLSKGRDGLEKTFDDGLPITIDEFYALLNKITFTGMKPIMYTGQIAGGQMEHIADSVWAQFEGRTNYEQIYKFNGEYTLSSGETLNLTPNTGYQLYQSGMEGRFKAAEFIKNIMLKKEYIGDVDGKSHTDAQGEFILSHAKQRLAMIIDGCWWENESRVYFNADEKNGEEFGHGKRDFRFMPLPQFDGHSSETDGKTYLTSHSESAIMVRKQTDDTKREHILNFLRTLISNDFMIRFTKHTSAMMAYNYEIPEEVKQSLSPFARNYIEIMTSDSVEIMKPRLLEQLTPFYMHTSPPAKWTVRISGSNYTNIYRALNENSLQSYISAVKGTYNASNWPTI